MSKQKSKMVKKIPRPPDPETSWEEQSAYFEKYGLDELEAAGLLEPVTDEDLAFVKQVQKIASTSIAQRTNRHQLDQRSKEAS
jgi:hypothetical protein